MTQRSARLRQAAPPAATSDELGRLADACARFAADLYFFVARRVVEDLGEAGEQAVRQGLWEFGLARGRAIRAAAEAAGDPIDLAAFLRHYNLPMGRAWRSTQHQVEDRQDSVVSFCPFADQWQARDGAHIGQMYCEEVDPAIRAGYDPRLRFAASQFILRGDDQCVQRDEMG